MAYSSLLGMPGGSDIKQRLSKALFDVSGTLASVKSGSLVQVWMPEHIHDGTIVLSCQGLPFAVAGVGDLLALFRCVSVRYRFSTDVMKPSLMGAIGRVYSTLEPEMSHNVQKYDKQVYLRVSEAQRCRVHSTLMVPVFGSDSRDTPLAVFELVQGDRDVTFPAVLSQLKSSLQSVNLYTTDLETAASAAGLRKWPMHIDALPGSEYDGTVVGRLSPTRDEPRRLNSSLGIQDVAEKEPAASSNVITTEEQKSPSTSTGDEAGSMGGEQGPHGCAARLSAGNTVGSQPFAPAGLGLGALQLPSGAQFGPPVASAASRKMPVPPQNKGTTPSAQAARPSGAIAGLNPETASSAPTGAPGFDAAVSNGTGGVRQSTAAAMDTSNAQQLVSWLAQQSATGNATLDQLRALLGQQQQQQQEEQRKMAEQVEAVLLQQLQQQAPSASQPRRMDIHAASTGHTAAVPPPDVSASPPKGSVPQPQTAADPAASAASAAAAALAAMADKPSKQQLTRSSSAPRTLGAGGEADEGDGEDISSGGEDDESDDERTGSYRNINRVGGGAGKRLRFEDLQAQFGLGLKEAANNLGICATTLKRACRRHGIKRWPRRQIAKLSKALNQMGYGGAPPPGLVQNAVGSAGASAAAQSTAKPKPGKKPDAAALQQATQLLFQHQRGAAAATAAAAGGGMFPTMAPAGMVIGGQLQGVPQGLQGMLGLGAQAARHQQQQQHQHQAGMFVGGAFLGPMVPMVAQHGCGTPSGSLAQGPQTLLGAMGGMGVGLSAAMQMQQGMGPFGGLPGGGMGAMQPAALGLQQSPAGAVGMQLQGSAPGGLPMHAAVPGAMLHPLLAGGNFGMHQTLHQQQQALQEYQQLQQQQQHLQQQFQAQAQHVQNQHQPSVLQQQQQQHHQQLQQHQISLHQHQMQQQQLGPAGSLQHLGSAEAAAWLGQGQCSAPAAGGATASMGALVMASSAAMDVGAPRLSCEDAPFSGLGMSPAMGGATTELCGLAEIPEDFIQNLNSTEPGQFGVLQSGNLGSGLELMDLLGHDSAAR